MKKYITLLRVILILGSLFFIIMTVINLPIDNVFERRYITEITITTKELIYFGCAVICVFLGKYLGKYTE